MDMPDLYISALLIVTLLGTDLVTFANLRLNSGSVVNGLLSADGRRVFMDNRLDALYFSAVTMTTLGYGDFLPSDGYSRLLVLFQLFSTALLLLFAFPILITRIGSWKK